MTDTTTLEAVRNAINCCGVGPVGDQYQLQDALYMAQVKALVLDTGQTYDADAIISIVENDLRRLASAALSVVGEPVAWLIKDFADGWIPTNKKEIADQMAAQGHAVKPLYALPPSQPKEGEATSPAA